MEDEWIEMEKQQPTISDMPIFISRPEHRTWIAYEWPICINVFAAHWKRYRDKPPEPKKLTQAEQDRDSCERIHAYNSTCDESSFRRGFFAALGDERSQIHNLVDNYNAGDLKPHEFIHAVIERVKA